jgi:hypothetical protein
MSAYDALDRFLHRIRSTQESMWSFAPHEVEQISVLRVRHTPTACPVCSVRYELQQNELPDSASAVCVGRRIDPDVRLSGSDIAASERFYTACFEWDASTALPLLRSASLDVNARLRNLPPLVHAVRHGPPSLTAAEFADRGAPFLSALLAAGAELNPRVLCDLKDSRGRAGLSEYALFPDPGSQCCVRAAIDAGRPEPVTLAIVRWLVERGALLDVPAVRIHLFASLRSLRFTWHCCVCACACVSATCIEANADITCIAASH